MNKAQLEQQRNFFLEEARLLTEAGDLTGERLERFEEAEKNLEYIEERLRVDPEQEARNAEIWEAMEAYKEGREVDEFATPSFAPTNEEVRQLYDAASVRQALRVETRATVTTTETGGEVARLDGRLVPEPRRIVSAVGLPAEPSPMKGVSGAKFDLELVAGPTAEGALKPEYDALTEQTAVPQTFARWTDITVQGLESLGGTANLVRAHTRQIAIDEDDHFVGLLTTEAGTPLAFDDDVEGNVKTAIARIEANVAGAADIIVLHPDDYKLLADTTPADADDVGSRVDIFSGAQLYSSNSATAGIALVAALRTVGRYITAGPLSVASLPDVKSNLVTIRTEVMSNLVFAIGGGVIAVDVVTP